MCVIQRPTLSSFLLRAQQVELFELFEIAARDNVKRPLLFTETSVADMKDNKPGPFTLSSASAKCTIIVESATLSDSEDDISFDTSQVLSVLWNCQVTSCIYWLSSGTCVPWPITPYGQERLNINSPGEVWTSLYFNLLPPFGSQVHFRLSTNCE